MNPRRKILVVSSTYPRWHGDCVPGFVHDLCQRLASEFEVEVIAPHFEGALKSQCDEHVRISRFQYFISRFQGLAYGAGMLSNIKRNPLILFQVPFYLLFLYLKVRKKLQGGDFNLVHVHWIIPNGLLIPFIKEKFNIPVLCTSHGSDLQALRGGFFRGVRRAVFEKVDYMTVVGAPMYEIALREGLSAEKLQIAPMGVDFDGKFVPLAELRCETPRVLFVGRLVRSKGAHLLLAAVEKLAAQAFNFSVDIAGDGPELENLEEEADARGVRGQVIFHGFQAGSDLVKLYQAADVVVVPSTQPEGLGLVTLEAMGCASAVLAPDFEINRTLLTHDVTGILYKAGDVESLAGCLAELLRNRKKREDIGLNARNWAVDHYGINSASERYILIMKRLIQAASTNPPPYNPSSAPQ